MAVEASKVKARLRALFPKANLSSKRLDEISDKLGKKIEDNATDAQIDEAVTEQKHTKRNSKEKNNRNFFKQIRI